MSNLEAQAELPASETVETPLAPQQQEEPSPEKIAEYMFSTYLPRFKMHTSRLSNKALRRVLNALIEVPLVEEMPKFPTDEEADCFNTGQALMQAKWMMIQHTMLEAEQLKGSTDGNNNESVEQTTVQEVNNNG